MVIIEILGIVIISSLALLSRDMTGYALGASTTIQRKMSASLYQRRHAKK